METRTNIERFKYSLDKGNFTMNEELTFIDLLLTKYKFISRREYAIKEGITTQGVMSRLKSKNDPYVKMLGKVFIIK